MSVMVKLVICLTVAVQAEQEEWHDTKENQTLITGNGSQPLSGNGNQPLLSSNGIHLLLDNSIQVNLTTKSRQPPLPTRISSRLPRHRIHKHRCFSGKGTQPLLTGSGTQPGLKGNSTEHIADNRAQPLLTSNDSQPFFRGNGGQPHLSGDGTQPHLADNATQRQTSNDIDEHVSGRRDATTAVHFPDIAAAAEEERGEWYNTNGTQSPFEDDDIHFDNKEVKGCDTNGTQSPLEDGVVCSNYTGVDTESLFYGGFHNDNDIFDGYGWSMDNIPWAWEDWVENQEDTDKDNQVSTVSSEGTIQVASYQMRAVKVWQYGTPVILSTGTLGNILSVCVICHKKILQSTTSMYLLVLAVVDTASLYTGLLHLYIKHVYSYDWRVLSTAACKLHMFGGSMFLQYGSWLLVSITLERLCAVYLPHKCRNIFTKRNVVIGLIIQAIVIITISAHYLATHDVITMKSGKKTCAATTNVPWYFTHFVWPWIDFCVTSLLPSLILLLSNSAIVFRIVQSESVRCVQLQAHGPAPKMNSMTAILLTVSVLFLITTAPLSIYIIRNIMLQLHADAVQRAQLSLLWTCLNLLLYTNNALNFLLYLISGPRFRREFSKMLCVWKTNSVQPSPDAARPPAAGGAHGKANRIHPTGTSSDTSPQEAPDTSEQCATTDQQGTEVTPAAGATAGDKVCI